MNTFLATGFKRCPPEPPQKARSVERDTVRQGRRKMICMAALLAAAVCPPSARGAVLRVKPTGDDGNTGDSWAAAKKTVTAAINACVAGDEIWVAQGVYHERIYPRNEVALYGGFVGVDTEVHRDQRDWRLNPTILDGDLGGAVVRFEIPFGTDATRLDGFTVRNGRGVMCGGILCVGTSPTLEHNRIVGNFAEGEGAGISCDSGAAPVIINNVIEGNYAGAGGEGGGICCQAGSSPLIQGNIIARNRAELNGGGICVKGGGSRPTILNNFITENMASEIESGLGGGALACVENGGVALVANNVMSANAGLEAGGILIYGGLTDNPVIVNNTLVGNAGAAIRWNNTVNLLTLVNNLIVQNTAGVARWLQNTNDNGSFVLANNDVFGNGVNYDGLPDPTGINGNLSVDPGLVSVTYGDSHLQPDSPCVNAGDNGFVQAGWTDLDGQNRALGGRVDIGADEADGVARAANPVIVRVKPDGNDNNDGSTWPTAKRTVGASIAAIHDTAIGAQCTLRGGEVRVRHGTYVQGLTLPPYVYLRGGFDEADERNPAAHVTVLDGGNTARVIRAWSGYRVSAVDGFTIQNGRQTGTSDDTGGGIECLHAGVSIQNNILRGNIANKGGAIHGFGAAPLIHNNVITNNLAGADGLGMGAGLYFDRSTPLIAANAIAWHRASDGAGLYCTFSKPSLLGNIITDNTGKGIFCGHTRGLSWLYSVEMLMGQNIVARNSTSDQGGGLHLRLCAGKVVNNLVVLNTSGIFPIGGGTGGGMSIEGGDENDADLLVANNSILGNTADYLGLVNGGGISVSLNKVANLILANNLVAYNNTGIWNGPYSPVSPVMIQNDFWSNSGQDYQAWGGYYGTIAGGPLTHPTDLSADPQMVNPTGGDFHLASASSPCVDAGAAAYAPAVDRDGRPRPLDGNADGTALPDVGCYEYLNASADTDFDRVTDGDEENVYRTNPVLRDSDGDRMADGDEVYAGTDPTNRLSLLVLTEPTLLPANGGGVVRWMSIAGKSYALERAPDLQSAVPFSVLQSHIAGQAGFTSWTDTTATAISPCFYRIRVE